MKIVLVLIILISTGFFVEAQENIHDKTSTPGQFADGEIKARNALQKTLREGNSKASANFNVHYYRCEWDVDPGVRFIRGVITSYFTITSPAGTITYDLHAALKVDSVLFRKKAVTFQHTSEHALIIQLGQSLSVNQVDSVSIFYQGIPPNEGYGSFVNTIQNGTPVVWTLSEPYGAKDWWPCKNGPDDKADSIDIKITYPDIYTSSSNGLLLLQIKHDGRFTDHWRHRYAISSYLVAFAITNFIVDKDSARIGAAFLPMRMYAYPENAVYFKNATQAAKVCLEKFSSLFGPYPFLRESYSQTQFGFGGGMEHQTNSFISSNQSQLVAHELAHQWFGDKVTCNSWEDIWLNEGFAQYAQFIYVENFEPAQMLAHLDNNRKRVTSLPGGSIKVNDTSNINRIFDGRLSYAKGACVLHMIRWRLGDSMFFRAIRQYLNDPLISYGTARTPDLIRNLEQVSGQSFTEFFRNWYEGEGFPSYQLQWLSNKNNWIKIKINQTTSHASVVFYAMPVPVMARSNNGRDTILVLPHLKNGEEFWVNPGFKVDTLIFDPEIRLLSDKNTVTKIDASETPINDIKIFPNPARERIYLSIKNPTGTQIHIQVLNAAAQLLYNKQLLITGRDELVDIATAHWPAGVYWLRIIGDNYNMVKKIVR